MTLFVRVPVCFPGVFGSDTAGNHHDSAPFFQPAYKFIAVIAFIRQNELACRLNQKVPTVPAPRRCHYGSHWRAKSAMDSQVHPLPHGLSSSSLPCSARFPRDIPLFSPTGMLVNLDRSAVQHQRCFVHQILLNQGCEDIVPILRLLSRPETDCIRFAMGRTAPADPAMESPCSASIESR